jgi:diadenosine tetraphosphate (Ap4A) HIT family hydrolase
MAIAMLQMRKGRNAPLTPGHTLVVPRQEIDQWTDAPQPLLHHCLGVARRIGEAAKQAFDAPRAGLVIAGLEVPHMHGPGFARHSSRPYAGFSPRG